MTHDNLLCNDGFMNYLHKLCGNQSFANLNFKYCFEPEFNSLYNSLVNNLELSIFHMNIRSLNSNQSSLLQLLYSIDNDFDIIILSEIWSNNIDFYCNLLKGYTLHHDLPINSNCGGLGIFIQNKIKAKLRPELSLQKSPQNRVEDIWMEITKNKKQYIIGGIYRHPDQNISGFSAALDDVLNSIAAKRTPCIIAGDININLLKYESHADTTDYINNLLTKNFLPTILMPTRITGRSATIIDHIYYYEGSNSKHEYNVHSGNIVTDITDHLPNYLLIIRNSHKVKAEERQYVRLFTKSNKRKFKRELDNIDWENRVYSVKDVDIAYNNFNDAIERGFQSAFPLTQLSRRGSKDKKMDNC